MKIDKEMEKFIQKYNLRNENGCFKINQAIQLEKVFLEVQRKNSEKLAILRKLLSDEDDENVRELHIDCINHSDRAYSDEELREMYFSGELTDFQPLDDSEFEASDYGFDWCDKCNKWILEEE